MIRCSSRLSGLIIRNIIVFFLFNVTVPLMVVVFSIYQEPSPQALPHPSFIKHCQQVGSKNLDNQGHPHENQAAVRASRRVSWRRAPSVLQCRV